MRYSQISACRITALSVRRAKNPGVAAPLASAGCRGNCLRMVDGRLGKIVLPTFISSRVCFTSQHVKDQHPEEVAGQLFLEGKKQRVVNIVTVAWLDRRAPGRTNTGGE